MSEVSKRHETVSIFSEAVLINVIALLLCKGDHDQRLTAVGEFNEAVFQELNQLFVEAQRIAKEASDAT